MTGKDISILQDSLTYILNTQQEADLKVDQPYESMNDIREAAISYARKHKFAVSTLRSGSRQLVLVCRHSGKYRVSKTREQEQNKTTRKKPSQKISCPFQIRAKPTTEKKWIIYKIIDEHNHEMASDIKAYAQHRKLTPESKSMIISFIVAGYSNSAIMDQLTSKGIQTVLKKDVANLRQTYLKQQQQQQQQQQQTEIYQPCTESSVELKDHL
ncbi:uncharacterized protein B0P05DRAFT_634670 [Gilbertella persicaria]|uniref:uncharacterized protein n=1 Tax=Gilbertella persicaria TaxID=101096 RepID=UPI00222009F1|nr:uncharacterized protein B0P05DRAFT_634670 [Gilbertella persicaria]KAI8090981.1 hypothetical protein B0P05DRAFT_634670 [Gilbertella persicaria]